MGLFFSKRSRCVCGGDVFVSKSDYIYCQRCDAIFHECLKGFSNGERKYCMKCFSRDCPSCGYIIACGALTARNFRCNVCHIVLHVCGGGVLASGRSENCRMCY